MALDEVELANEILSGLGKPPPVTNQIIALATGIVRELKEKAQISIPDGAITEMTGFDTANKIVETDPADFPSTTPQLIGTCSGIVKHIQEAGSVSFDLSGGVIVGLDGIQMAAKVVQEAVFPSTTPEIIGMCTAISNYIMDKASITLTGEIS